MIVLSSATVFSNWSKIVDLHSKQNQATKKTDFIFIYQYPSQCVFTLPTKVHNVQLQTLLLLDAPMQIIFKNAQLQNVTSPAALQMWVKWTVPPNILYRPTKWVRQSPGWASCICMRHTWRKQCQYWMIRDENMLRQGGHRIKTSNQIGQWDADFHSDVKLFFKFKRATCQNFSYEQNVTDLMLWRLCIMLQMYTLKLACLTASPWTILAKVPELVM